MSELVADMEDWTLEAIVRGTSGDFFHTTTPTNGHDHRYFFEDPRDHDQIDFPSIFEMSNGGSSEELEELYKPFYTAAAPVSGSGSSSNNNNNNSDHLPPARAVIDFQQRPMEDDMADDKPFVDQSTRTGCAARVTTSAGYTPKYKRRKNQHKRVVMQVSAEGLASDMWAWRKYGQKPIKGSPYPRSYYRCSSSKGCLARKQVEQSFTDEGMFIVTYTAEHSHSQPTRRNSLAGTVRQKFPSHQNNKNVASGAKLTPTTAVPEKTEESQAINSHHARIKDEEINIAEDSNALMSDFAYDDDFFSGFKDFDDDHGFAAELPMGDAYNYETQQDSVMANCRWF